MFDDFDMDNSGLLDYKELNKQLRQGAGSALDPRLKPGAAGEIGTTSTNKHKLRRRDPNAERPKGSVMRGAQLDSDKPVQEQLRDLLTANAVRVIDLFREWDEDHSGTVDKKEFRKALQALGVQAEKKEIDELFDSFDADRSGSLEYSELNKVLRRGGTVALDPSLQAGGAGAIELSAKNKSPSKKTLHRKESGKGGFMASMAKNIDHAKGGGVGAPTS